MQSFSIIGLTVFLVLTGGCGGPRTALRPDRACAMLDSVYSTCGFDRAVALTGKLTIDADQRRLRGKVELRVDPSGDIALDFASSLLFGTEREDFFFSIAHDTLRIIDRERGAYYESDEAERFVGENLGIAFAARRAVSVALGRAPDCRDLDDVTIALLGSGGIRFEARVDGEAFEAVFSSGGGLLVELLWPVRLSNDERDRLRVIYGWESGADGTPELRRVVMRLEEREWRCRIDATTG